MQSQLNASQATVKPQNGTWRSSSKENAIPASHMKHDVPGIFPKHENVEANPFPGFVGQHALPTSCVMQVTST